LALELSKRFGTYPVTVRSDQSPYNCNRSTNVVIISMGIADTIDNGSFVVS